MDFPPTVENTSPGALKEPGVLPDERFLALESCHSTWLFDLEDLRFCRVLKSSALPSTVATGWRSYDRLVIHPSSDAFVDRKSVV